MLQPLGDYIRLHRQQRNLTQERLAKLAGVSRRQLSLLEDGRNVSVLFLLKIAEALELTEVPVGGLRMRTAPADLAGFVEAACLLERLQRSMSGMESDLSRAVSVVRGAMERAMGHGLSTRAVEEAADTLATLPPEERDAANETLRALAGRDPAIPAPRPKSAPAAGARRRSR